MATTPWRVVLLTVVPQVATGYSALLRALGHEPVAVIAPRVRANPALVEETPAGLDVLYAASKRSLGTLLAAYEPDLALCTGYPWRIPQDVLDVPRLGIVNGHPSLLPRYRGPFPISWAIRNGDAEIGQTFHLMDADFDTGNVLAQGSAPLADDETWESLVPKLEALSAELLPEALARLAAGDRGDAQAGDEYFGAFEDDYVTLDTARTAAEAHRQVRAWTFMPPFARRGPLHDGRLVTGSSLDEVEGATPVQCADGTIWITLHEDAS